MIRRQQLINPQYQTYMGINRSLLPQKNGNLPLPFLVVITLLFSWTIFINYCIFILTGSPGFKKIMIVYVIQKNEDNKNSSDSLNVIVNHHYHSENRVITQ